MKIYYAHSMHLYGKPQEQRDVELLQSMGFEVENPSNPEHVDICTRIKDGDEELMKQYMNYNRLFESASEIIMNYFEQVVSNCDALAFRAYPDGKIPAGVAREVIFANKIGHPVIELPNLLDSRYISVHETRQYLNYLGER